MCGFLGSFSQFDEDTFLSALDLISHRGPDQTGSLSFDFSLGTLRLGFKRLSIQDLSPNGNQPMVSHDKRFVLVFNGEIFNFHELRSQLLSLGYHFNSRCDTEVLLNAWSEWGIACLPKLDGMFAFCIFDSLTNTLTLVRDPFGIKPLYYFSSSTELCFSSEICAILSALKLPRTINYDTSFTYLFEGTYDRSQDTFFKNIKRLMPGYFIQFSLSTLQVVNHRPWYTPSILNPVSLSYSQSCEQFRELFLQSVRRQLRSDVPFGITLSGGLDSSSILSAVRYLEPSASISTFSYTPGNCSEDESKWIDIMNISSNSNPNYVTVDSSSFNQQICSFITAQGEPVSSLSYFAEFLVYQDAYVKGIKVMIDGHGADELLCGYSSYPINRLTSLLRSSDFNGLFSYLKNWSLYPGRSTSQSIQNLILACSTFVGFKPESVKAFLKHSLYRNLFTLSNYQSIKNYDLLNFSSASSDRDLINQLRIDLTVASCPPQLRSADRSAMFSSIENRVPFLSNTLSDFIFTLPERFIAPISGASKQLMRDSLVGIVPQVILDRTDKIGYKTPDSLSISISPVIFDRLSSSLSKFDFFNNEKVLNHILCHEQNTLSSSPISWRIFNFLLWADINQVTA